MLSALIDFKIMILTFLDIYILFLLLWPASQVMQSSASSVPIGSGSFAGSTSSPDSEMDPNGTNGNEPLVLLADVFPLTCFYPYFFGSFSLLKTMLVI